MDGIRGFTNETAGHNGTDERHHLDAATQAIQILFLTLLSLAGAIGNIMMLYCLFTIQEMKKATGILLRSLVLTDLGITVFCVPFAIASTADHRLVHGQLFCSTTGFMLILFLDSSLLSMAVISIKNYKTVGYRLRPGFTRTHALYAASAIWTISLLFALAPTVGWDFYAFSRNGQQCAPSGRHLEGLVYNIVSLSCCLVFPAMTMVYCNVRILVFIRAHLSRMNACGIPKPNFSRRSSVSPAEHRLVKTLMLIMLLFFVSWIPCLVYVGLEIAGLAYSPLLEMIVIDFAFTKSAVNPILYALRHREFQRGFKHLCLKVCLVKRQAANDQVQSEHVTMTALAFRIHDKPSSSVLPGHPNGLRRYKTT